MLADRQVEERDEGYALALRNAVSVFQGWFPALSTADISAPAVNADLLVMPRSPAILLEGLYAGSTTAQVSVALLDAKRVAILDGAGVGRSALTFSQKGSFCSRTRCPCQAKYAEIIQLRKAYNGYKPTFFNQSVVDSEPTQELCNAVSLGMRDLADGLNRSPEFTFILHHLDFFCADGAGRDRLLDGVASAASNPGTGAMLVRYAIRSRSLDLLDQLLKRGLPGDVPVPDDGRYPMHWAAALGETEAIVRLVTAGASVNARDREGHLPIYFAVWNAHPATVFALLDRGSEPDIADPEQKEATAAYLETVGMHCANTGKRDVAVDCLEQAMDYHARVIAEQQAMVAEAERQEQQAASSRIMAQALLGAVQSNLQAQSQRQHTRDMAQISALRYANETGSGPVGYHAALKAFAAPTPPLAAQPLPAMGMGKAHDSGLPGGQGNASSASERISLAAGARQRLFVTLMELGGGRVPRLASDQARVYIYRTWQGGPAHLTVEAGGHSVRQPLPAARGFVFVDGPPGKWVLWVQDSQRDGLRLSLGTGESQYVRLDPDAGVFSVGLKAVHVETGAGACDLAYCTYTESPAKP